MEAAMETGRPFVITISRQLGAGGFYVGRLVAHRLGYRYVDREILRQAALALGIAEEEVRDKEERLSRAWERILEFFALGGPESIYLPPPVPIVHDRDLFEVEAAILKKMAGERSCVIVGKGAAHILKGHPRLLRVFLHAPVEFRVARLMRVRGIPDPAEARRLVETCDENRRRFHRSMAGVDWNDARNYDLCINTGVVDLMQAREMIVSLADRERREA
jgi:cytidylate kinase